MPKRCCFVHGACGQRARALKKARQIQKMWRAANAVIFIHLLSSIVHKNKKKFTHTQHTYRKLLHKKMIPKKWNFPCSVLNDIFVKKNIEHTHMLEGVFLQRRIRKNWKIFARKRISHKMTEFGIKSWRENDIKNFHVFSWYKKDNTFWWPITTTSRNM